MNQIMLNHQFGELLWSFVCRDVQIKYKGTVGGVLWSFLNPLLTFCIYLIVFGFFLKVRMPTSSSVWEFALYFSAGFFPWVFIQNAIIRSSTTIIDNRNYIKKVSFPAEIFPLSIVLAESIGLLISIGITVAFSIYLKGFSFILFLIPVAIALEITFAVACSFLISSITVFFRDVPQILNSVFMAWFWITPIAYTSDLIPAKLKFITIINPAYHILEIYRAILLRIAPENQPYIFLFAIGVAVMLLLCFTIFQHLKLHFSDLL